MTATLLLRLAGPLQAWGVDSRFNRRTTGDAPSKSGVLGMLAAALGMRRTDDLTELLDLRFAVRMDQPGRHLRDFQTARSLDGRRTMPLSYRHYLSDAVYVAAVEGDMELVTGLDAALRRPEYPLYLGRRACPPANPIRLADGLKHMDLMSAFRACPWQASKRHATPFLNSPHVDLEVRRDARGGEDGDSVRDVPITFDPEHRRHGWRRVVADEVTCPNRHFDSMAVADEPHDHDPMSTARG